MRPVGSRAAVQLLTVLRGGSGLKPSSQVDWRSLSPRGLEDKGWVDEGRPYSL